MTFPAFSIQPHGRCVPALRGQSWLTGWTWLTWLCGLALSMACMDNTAAHANKHRQTHKARPTATTVAATSAVVQTYAGRPELLSFADELQTRYPQMERAWIDSMLADARLVPSVRRFIMPAASPRQKNWAVYRSRFVEPTRIRAGVAFWNENESQLQAAEARWKVPAAIIVGIIGVETIYGRQTGGFRVLDALSTLTFDFPPGRSDRSPYFRAELGDFLFWAWRQGTDARAPLGSYAGAMGLPQFMPSSVLKHAVDFDGDGRIDLHGSTADVIGSVANYLANFGWQPGLPTHYSVTPPADEAQRAALLAPDIQPTFTAADMMARGAQLSPAGQGHTGALALVELRNGDGEPDWVAGTQNFWVITRYNWSAFYALSVIELGEAVARARSRSTTGRAEPPEGHLPVEPAASTQSASSARAPTGPRWMRATNFSSSTAIAGTRLARIP